MSHGVSVDVVDSLTVLLALSSEARLFLHSRLTHIGNSDCIVSVSCLAMMSLVWTSFEEFVGIVIYDINQNMQKNECRPWDTWYCSSKWVLWYIVSLHVDSFKQQKSKMVNPSFRRSTVKSVMKTCFSIVNVLLRNQYDSFGYVVNSCCNLFWTPWTVVDWDFTVCLWCDAIGEIEVIRKVDNSVWDQD